MRDVNGGSGGHHADELDRHLLVLCSRFQAAHDDWLACIEGGAGEPEESASATLLSRRAEWTRELGQIRACPAHTLAGVQAKLAVLHALQAWRDLQDVALLQMHEEVAREREKLGQLPINSSVPPVGERWILGPPPEPIRSWLNMFGGSWSRRRQPDRRLGARRTGSQD